MSKLLGIFFNGDPARRLLQLAVTAINGMGGKTSDLAFFDAALSPQSALAEAKRADAIIFGGDLNSSPALEAVKKELKLHTLLRSNRAFDLVTPSNISDICSSGYTSVDGFGRAAYDKIVQSELEIERTARVAYELAELTGRSLALLDRADVSLTSRLWRKIVTDINEDYPSVHTDMYLADDRLSLLSKKDGLASDRAPACSQAVLLTQRLLGDMIWAALGESGFACYMGDGPVAAYAPTDFSMGVIGALPHLLSHCLDMKKEAAALASALGSLNANSDFSDIENILKGI